MSTFTQTYKPLACTLGTDPEIFAVRGRELLPAFNFLPHRDASPTLYWDGFALEGNVPPRDSIAGLGRELYDLICRFDEASRAVGGRLTLQNAFKVPPKQMAGASDEQVALGCKPSYNAYGLRGKLGESSRELKWRFAGGHIHIGNNEVLTSELVELEAIKAMDATVGVASVVLASGIDSPKRREYYGLPGEFRRPAHGLEYRTLSNFWLSSPLVFQLVFSLAKRGFELGVRGLRRELEGSEDEVTAIIRDSDAAGATAYIAKNADFFKWCIQISSPATASFACDLLQTGVWSTYGKRPNLLETWERERFVWSA